MALVRTTLTAPITASQITFGVASTANQAFPAVGAAPLVYQPLQIDDEIMFLVGCPATNTVTVRMRGSDGTDAVSHDVGSAVVTSASPQDFPVVQPGMLTQRPASAPDIVTYGQAGAIAVPTEATTYAFLAPTTNATAYTLGAPSLALNGLELTLTLQSAFSCAVTTPGATGTTGLYFTGAAGAPFTIATFAAASGASMQLVAQNGSWNVINASITPVTFS